jgi:hypothetical protein
MVLNILLLDSHIWVGLYPKILVKWWVFFRQELKKKEKRKKEKEIKI